MLVATIEILPRQPSPRALQLKLRIKNTSGLEVTILNPSMGVPSPLLKKRLSLEEYQVSLLMSFGYLSISVTDRQGQEVPQQSLQTWSTPALLQPVKLQPGDSLDLIVPLGSFYELEAGKTYAVALTYGDSNLKVSARAQIIVPGAVGPLD